MYIQIFILVKAASFIEGIRRSTSVTKNEPTKQHRYFDETKEKSGNYCKWLAHGLGSRTLKNYM